MSYSLRPHGHSTPGFPILHCLPEFAQTQWCCLTILSSATPFSFCLQSFPDRGLFQWGSSSHQMAEVWKLQLQHQSFQWLIWSSWSPGDPQESSPAPSFKIINYSVLSLPYGPTLTSIHDSWINHSFAYMDICLQSDVFLLICCVF